MWTTRDIPPQRGKRVIVTGATSGIGRETALALAAAGADVLLAVRDTAKGESVRQGIRALLPDAHVSVQSLDLSDLASVYGFGWRMLDEGKPIDCLINNAGVMAPLKRQQTVDGFELQFGTNYLGHYALTAKLLPLLRGGRVVSLASLAHKRGQIDFDDLQAVQRYSPWRTYAQSKLAMLMFALELQRRSDEEGWGVQSVAAHPGWTNTALIANGPALQGGLPWSVVTRLAPMLTQSAPDGALPTLYAATVPDAPLMHYIGPSGRGERQGAPSTARIMPQAQDAPAAARLWEASRDLTAAEWGMA